MLWILNHSKLLAYKRECSTDDSLSRYVDILLGLLLLTSLVSLEYGSMKWERKPLAVFLILSLATMAVYWLWSLFGNSVIEVE